MLEKILAGSGAAAALAASMCCVVPLSLTALGVSGAWLASFSVLAPYQTGLRALAIILLGTGFWIVYGRPAKGAEGSSCAITSSQRGTKGALWLGAIVMALVLTSGWWQQFIS
jgi:mercuric ion transport protein